jgi:hypothetical protein
MQDIPMPKFEKGNPGGPGRPRGSRNAMNAILDQLAVEGAETMVKAMIAAAGEGDRVAARLVLNRIWSAPKGRAVAIELPEIRTPADLLAAHAAIVKAIADQTITPQDGAALSSVLETHRRAFELVAQEEKIEELSQRARKWKEELKR